MGSPLYADLCERLAADVDDVRGEGLTSRLLARWATADPRTLAREVPSVRLLGGLHRLVLAGRAPRLARYYPSVGGRAAPDDDLTTTLLDVLRTHEAELALGLDQPPQTNEVGRAGPLVGGLLVVAARTGGLPVRLVEIGASAGLNLRADHLPVGPGRAIDTPLPHLGWALPPVVERLGGDLAPVDPTTDEGRLLLQSYVWADDLGRLARLRTALDVAREVPVAVQRAGAAELVGSLTLRPAAVTVLWHSVMWQYVGEAERTEVRAGIARLGAQASADAPFAHLRFEPQPDGAGDVVFLIRLTTWPGPVEQVLGRAPAHGVPVVWDVSHG